MKVLFAVNNEEISEAIVKKYQKKYKEIISYKNVYYFNAILKEIQKDKSYDRIVVSEDLEQFTNSSYEQMDKFIFERLDSISDEASNMKGEDIPIILICTERRRKSEEILVKLFGIGIYNAIIGEDRSIDEVCRLINKPRLKKEAKNYYQIDSDEVSYKAENEDDVSEVEIQNILAHFKRLGKNESKYVESYDNIAEQYNDNQLKVISKFLPLGVRAVLEEKSSKYQQVMAFNKAVSSNLRRTPKTKDDGLSQKLLTNPKRTTELSSPIVIPSSMNTANNVRKLTRKVQQQPKVEEIEELEPVEIEEEPEPIFNNSNQPEISQISLEDIEPVSVPQESKSEIESEPIAQEIEEKPKRGRGRPRKYPIVPEDQKPKRGRGRPRKNPLPEEETEEPEEEGFITLPNLEDSYEDIDDNFEDDNTYKESSIEELNNDDTDMLPGIEDDDTEYDELENNVDSREDADDEDDEYEINLFNSHTQPIQEEQPTQHIQTEQPIQGTQPIRPIIQERPEPIQPIITNPIISNFNDHSSSKENIHVDISDLLHGNKKVAAFVGTSKNGTSFIVNNLAEVLSSAGINVAILDTTRNRNAYYIYTKNEEDLRRVAMSSISNLSNGIANGIRVNSNLAVYTSLPNEDNGIESVREVLETLVKSHTVVLIDCDFWTPKGYFSAAQEVYLIQTMDVLTIQPLTAFLKELVVENILEEQKIRVIINKYVKIKGITEKEIIGGMAFYNDPAMTYQTGLFDKASVKYMTIPFEEETYTKYLQGLINCEISLKGYSKIFIQNLRQLGNMIYPTASGKKDYRPPALDNTGSSNFSSSMNNTLDQMKRNY